MLKSRFNFRIKLSLWLGCSLSENNSLQGDISFNDISGREHHLIAYGEADFYIYSLYPFQKQSRKMCLQSPSLHSWNVTQSACQ